ncbi:uncharacterized protein LOC133796097 [Humulus lupulus]|uniref:uncharacterized protein LOC133796097 n=1 Tax=Humulus lupulus TaxID=3486 RepID=UPI002B411B48|nr:uncharacterized protein LOC133796097 [Humulus lupulus]
MGALFLRMFRDWCFTSNSAWHNNGRIVVAWDPAVFSVDIQFCSSQCTHCWVEPRNGLQSFYCTFVYAFNEEVRRVDLWKDLRCLRSQKPWVLLGDFNATINIEEKVGVKVRTLHYEAFRECMIDCDLEDVQFNGCFHTWSNKQDPPDRIVAKLDRVLGNNTWMEVFEKATRFSVYNDIISAAWSDSVQGVPMFKVITKLKRVKIALKHMNKSHVGDVISFYSSSSSELERVQQAVHIDPLNPYLIDEERRIMNDHERIKGIYLDFLKQKSRMLWIQQGDANTNLLHRSLKARRKQNSVMAIRDNSGVWQETAEGVQHAFLEYYNQLLGDKMDNRIKVKASIMKEGPVLSSNNIQDLLKPFGKDEVREAVFRFPMIKLRGRMVLIVLSFKSIGILLERRLREVLPHLVAEKQSGFIKGRSIGQNVLVCQELLKHYGRSNCKPSCTIKMDIRKAYDTLDWDFLEEMLEAFGFPSQFMKLIMVCVKTPKFSLMINGMLHGFFSSKRGLRQGDPISPLLFVLRMEYLNRIFMKVARHEKFRFHDRCSDLQLTHMCFADDVILFMHGDFMSIYLMLQGVELFSKSSGLQINNSKTEIICRGMVDEEIQRVLQVSKFREGSLPIKYLGIPINSKGISAIDCASIVDKMVARIKNWSWKYLSFAARLGAMEFDGAGNVAWEDVCKSKAKGGLGIRDVDLWNIAAMGKYVWAVAKNKESLWGEEDIWQLFFGCCYSNSCLAQITEWLGWKAFDRTLNGLLRWLVNVKGVSQFWLFFGKVV